MDKSCPEKSKSRLKLSSIKLFEKCTKIILSQNLQQQNGKQKLSL